MLEFVLAPESNRGDNLLKLYDRFIAPIETKLNQLRLMRIVAQVATQYYPSRPCVGAELDRAIALFDALKDKRGRLGDEAYLVCATERLSLLVRKAVLVEDPLAQAADLDAIKAQIEEAQVLLESLVDANPVAVASYYRVRAEYHKVRGTAADFYHNALQYLAHTNVDTMAADASTALAVDIALAALVGEKVFNFGEIVAHPIMARLTGTPHEWLAQLLRVFHTGDIDGFNTIVAANRGAYESQPALAAADQTVKEKVAIVCVMEMATTRPATDRSIPFADVAAATRLPVDHVEWLLMRAMSQGLLRGVIDQVEETVHISFIKPRVMDRRQIVEMQNRIEAWSQKVKGTLLYMEDNSREIFA